MFAAIGAVAAAVIGGYMASQGAKDQNSRNTAQSYAAFSNDYGVMKEQMAFSREQADQQEVWNDQNTAQARAYATEMANTQHQRGIADLRAAGLNPILAAGGGAASAPSVSSPAAGQAATPGAPRMNPVRMENALGPAVSSAMQAARAIPDILQVLASTQQTAAQTETEMSRREQIETQTEALRKATGLTMRQSRTEDERAAGVRASTAHSIASARLAGEQAQTEPARRENLRAETERREMENRRFRDWGGSGSGNLGHTAESIARRLMGGLTGWLGSGRGGGDGTGQRELPQIIEIVPNH